MPCPSSGPDLARTGWTHEEDGVHVGHGLYDAAKGIFSGFTDEGMGFTGMLGTFGEGLFVFSVEGLELGEDVIRHELFHY
jgi:hypothetical protein